jgi:hypothetical protein
LKSWVSFCKTTQQNIPEDYHLHKAVPVCLMMLHSMNISCYSAVTLKIFIEVVTARSVVKFVTNITHEQEYCHCSNRIGEVYSLEYTGIPKAFFTYTPHHIGHCCSNVIEDHCCILDHSFTNVIPGHFCTTVCSNNGTLGSHCCTTVVSKNVDGPIRCFSLVIELAKHLKV